MWTIDDTTLTTTSMTAVSWSTRSDQSAWRLPDSIQLNSGVVRTWPWTATSKNTTIDSTADAATRAQVMSSDAVSPRRRPSSPATTAPSSGRNTMATSMPLPLALHHIDVFDGDRPAVAEIDHQDGEADRRFRGGDGQHEHGEHLAHQVVQEGRERHQVDVDRQQHQLDRHQDDDDVLAVEEDAEDAEREQDGGNRQVMGEADLDHQTPLREGIFFISMLSAPRRASWLGIDWRRTPTRSRKVSTMAPIMATSRTIPAVSKR